MRFGINLGREGVIKKHRFSSFRMNIPTTFAAYEQGYASTLTNSNDLLVLNVVLIPLHVYNMSMLSNNYAPSREVIPYSSM